MCIFIFLTVPLSLFGQKQYERGFVVLNNQDTLFGFIKDRKPPPFGGLYKKIRFKGKKGRSKYGPEQIRAYQKAGSMFESVWIQDTGHFLSQNYTSIPNVGEQRFLKVIVKGYLTYYQWEFEDDESDYIDAIDLFKKQDNSSLIRVTQGLFGLKRKSLKRFFKDCPPLVERLESKEIKHPIDVANFYNSWKGSQPR